MPTSIEIGNSIKGGTGSFSAAFIPGDSAAPFTFVVNVADAPLYGATSGVGVFALPLANPAVFPASSYNFEVNWGDGTTDTITSYNQAEATHTYSSPYSSEYTIKITGTCVNFGFAFQTPSLLDVGKLRDITFWGGGQNLELNGALAALAAITQGVGSVGLIPTAFSATDSCKVVGNAVGIFTNSSGVTKGTSNWDMSACTIIQSMFSNASNWNEDVSGWDVSNIINATSAFNNTSFSQANYDKLLISWAAQSVQSNVTFGASGTQYTAGGAAEAARNTLINTYNWTIVDGGPN